MPSHCSWFVLTFYFQMMHFLDFWLIYARLSQNVVVAIYALFPQISWDWKVESADFFAFRMYERGWSFSNQHNFWKQILGFSSFSKKQSIWSCLCHCLCPCISHCLCLFRISPNFWDISRFVWSFSSWRQEVRYLGVLMSPLHLHQHIIGNPVFRAIFIQYGKTWTLQTIWGCSFCSTSQTLNSLDVFEVLWIFGQSETLKASSPLDVLGQDKCSYH